MKELKMPDQRFEMTALLRDLGVLELDASQGRDRSHIVIRDYQAAPPGYRPMNRHTVRVDQCTA